MLLLTLKSSVILPLALAGAEQPIEEQASPAEEAEAMADDAVMESEEDIVVEGEIDPRHVKKCRYVRGINSRVPKKVCRTQAEEEAYEKAAQAQVEEMQRGQQAREMAGINKPG